MDKFGIIVNAVKDKNYRMTNKIYEFLKSLNKQVYIRINHTDLTVEHITKLKKEDFCDEIDCAIILGGDGTIIGSARELAMHEIPIIGINLGTVGFLAEVEKEQALEVIKTIIEDKYIIENRMMLDTEIVENNTIINKGVGLNDVVISRGGLTRVIELSIYVNNQLVDVYHADGVIISTPTGSTAYNLSAGGPILNPYTKMMVITPICPHSLSARSIVVSGDDEVKVCFADTKKEGDVIVTIDGQVGYELCDSNSIKIKQSPYITKLIKLEQNNYYSLLRKKLGSK